MLLLSMLLANSPLMASNPQVTDNPFTQNGQTNRKTRHTSAKRPAARTASSSGRSVFYANCSAARAAGAAPVMRGAPGYSRKLDRDNDGVGCE